jgi:hypothetical protein
MPQQLYYQHYCNTTNAAATTAQITWPQWTTSSSSNNYTYVQNYGTPTFYTTYTTTSSTISPNQIWQQWINAAPTYGSYAPTQVLYAPETAEQRLDRARAQEERKLACVRARTLLEGFLSEEQKLELEAHGRFHVTGSKGRRYCIHTSGQAGNVDLLKPDGSLQASLCAHPGGALPDGDAWLMQMLELRHDEDHFLRTANVHRGLLPAAA